MGFRFRLETVLRHKRQIVDEIAGRLARAQRLVRQEQDTLEVLEGAQAGHRAYYAATLAERALHVPTLRTAVEYAQFLDLALAEQRHRIREMQDRTDKIRQLLVEAERAHRVMERLKERYRDRFYRELAVRDRVYYDGVANTMFTAKHQAATRLEER